LNDPSSPGHGQPLGEAWQTQANNKQDVAQPTNQFSISFRMFSGTHGMFQPTDKNMHWKSVEAIPENIKHEHHITMYSQTIS
jgi:hypothetical protein